METKSKMDHSSQCLLGGPGCYDSIEARTFVELRLPISHDGTDT